MNNVEMLTTLIKHLPGKHVQQRHAGSSQDVGGTEVIQVGSVELYEDEEDVGGEVYEVVKVHNHKVFLKAYKTAVFDTQRRKLYFSPADVDHDDVADGSSSMPLRGKDYDRFVSLLIYGGRVFAATSRATISYVHPNTNEEIKAYEVLYDVFDQLVSLGLPATTPVVVNRYGIMGGPSRKDRETGTLKSFTTGFGFSGLESSQEPPYNIRFFNRRGLEMLKRKRKGRVTRTGGGFKITVDALTDAGGDPLVKTHDVAVFNNGKQLQTWAKKVGLRLRRESAESYAIELAEDKMWPAGT